MKNDIIDIKAESKPKRNSSIELLRIISMLFIVISHYAVHGNVNPAELSFGFNKLLLDSIDFGKLGVAIFVMITGYFMSESKFKINRVINIILQTLFYSISIFVIFCLIDRLNFSVTNAISSFLPITTGSYWFVTAFVILSVFVPFINKLLSGLSRNQFAVFITVLVFIWSFAPTFLTFDSSVYGGYISLFITFYCLGAYLRLFPDNKLSHGKNSIIVFAVSFVLLILSSVIIDILGERYSAIHGMASKFYSFHSVLIVIIAVSLLSVFAYMKPFYSSIINTVAGCTFGVYLIHENSFMRGLIWKQLFNNSNYSDSVFLILHLLISVIIVYTGCSLIEYIRKTVIEKYVFKHINNKISSLAERAEYKLFNIFDK